MAWPNPFHRRDENTRTVYGYTFQLTTEHLTPEQTQLMKQSYDILGEQALESLNAIPTLARNNLFHRTPTEGSRVEDVSEEPTEAKRDLYQLLQDNAKNDDVLNKLWVEVTTVPQWVDWEQISRGQDVFYRYGVPTVTGLVFQSLLGGMGDARIVETLARTGGFSKKGARHRLFETAQHILQCTTSLSSIQPKGAGHASSIRVRLVHAAVRQRIMKLAQGRPSYYDVDAWGIPINDLDCIATIGTFSATLIWISLPRQGIWLTKQEIIDYIALWRYIAYLTGTPTAPFETPEKAKTTMEALIMYEIKPTKTGKALADNIIKSLAGQPPTYANEELLLIQARWLNGRELCDDLGLRRPPIYYWALVVVQNFLLMVFCYICRTIPCLDRFMIAALREFLWKIVVEYRNGLGEVLILTFKALAIRCMSVVCIWALRSWGLW